jgi:phage FluMu protein Com
MKVCPRCGVLNLSAAQQFGAKLAFGAGGALLGLNATKDPAVAAVCLLAGILIGNEIDKRCPQCGAILQVMQILS